MRASELSKQPSSTAKGGRGGGACREGAAGYNRTALGYDCPLFARKFPRETAGTVLDLYARWLPPHHLLLFNPCLFC